MSPADEPIELKDYRERAFGTAATRDRPIMQTLEGTWITRPPELRGSATPEAKLMESIFGPGNVSANPAGAAEAEEDEMSNPTREEFKAGLDLVEARTDLKFEKLNSKLDQIVAGQTNLSNEMTELKRAVSTNKTVYITLIVGSALTIVGLVLGVLAFGGQVMEIASGIFQAGQQVGPQK